MSTDDNKPKPLFAPRKLTDGVVAIRPLLAADAPAYAAAFREDESLGVRIGAEHDPTDEEVVAQSEEGPRPGRVPALVIADADSLEFLGSIGLYRIDEHHRRGEVGFWLAPHARGRGAATRAVRLITNWAFDSLGFARVEITTTPDNTRVRRIARSLGFVEEGVMRHRNLERGRRVDVMMLAVLKPEWRE